MNNKIWLSSPHMGGTELNYVHEAFNTNWVAPLGKNVDGFEEDLAKFTGVKHVAALSSGTAAIHLALVLLGIKAGDEVICQSLTFSASANPIVYLGATPIFIDSEKDTWNIDTNLLETAIVDRINKGKKPKAIIFVHLYGMPAKVNEIVELANKFEIPLIEDAAEALGSLYHGKHVGGFGEIGILSFNGNKIITTSGGGALISNNKTYVINARVLATQARDEAPHYQHSQIGYNYRMSNVLAGIGRGQMEVLETRIRQRRAIYEFYKKELSKFEEIEFLDEPSDYFSNRWLTTIIIKQNKNGITRETIRLSLNEDNIESRPIWKPMHLQPVFANTQNYINGVSEYIFNNGLCLPSGSNNTEDDLKRVTNRILRLFK